MKRTNSLPFIFRSMLLSIFLPIFIALGILIHTLTTRVGDSFWGDQSLIGGIPIVWFFGFLVTFPYLLGIWLFWKGRWRLPVFVAGILYFGILLLACFGYLEQYTPPEKRTIHLSLGSVENTDVYCNGVCLGQTPLKIRVEELKAKVPEWTTPPEQPWYSEDVAATYTWFPWDDFRDKKRFLETKELLVSAQQLSSSIQKKQSALYDAGCRYWWRFENNKSRILVSKIFNHQYYHNQPFEQIQQYFFANNDIIPQSARIHAWLLVDVLDKLTEAEKNDWDKHVLKHWILLHNPLIKTLTTEADKYRLKNPADPRVKLFETALDSTARLKYGLSDPPTEEECRRLLTNWVNESADKSRPFAMINSYYGRIDGGKQVAILYREDLLINPAVRLMGETIRKPLVEQWKTNYYRLEDGWAPLIYVSEKDCSPEYFNDFVRYCATTCNGRIELLTNQNEQVIPLFKTILYQKQIVDMITLRVNHYHEFVSLYGQVNNPLLEPIFRDYIVYALSDPKHSEASFKRLNRAILKAIFDRINRKEMDKDELAVWVNSLPLKQTVKDTLLRKIHVTRDGEKSFADLIEQASQFMVQVETEITAEDVNHWFAENPNGTLNKFYKEFSEKFRFWRNTYVQNLYNNTTMYSPTGESQSMVDDKEFSRYFVTALLNTNTPETQNTIKQLCNNDTDQGVVLLEIVKKFSPMFLVDSVKFFDSSIDFPDFILDIFEALSDNDEKMMLASRLELCPSPRAEQLLEKWSQAENPLWKQRFTRNLENWRKRKEIQEQTKKLFHELVEEKILPDDLLIPQTPCVWKDGKYVR